MTEQNNIKEKARDTFSKKKVLLLIGITIGIAIICFTLIAILPPPKGPFFKAPLRSFLTGLGLLGVASPLFIVGFLLEKRAATSPYFEEAFIKTVFNIFAFVCFILGLICIGLSIYALVRWALSSG